MNQGIIDVRDLFNFELIKIDKLNDPEFQSFVLELESDPGHFFYLPTQVPEFAMKLQDRFAGGIFGFDIRDVRLLKKLPVLSFTLYETFDQWYSLEINQYCESKLTFENFTICIDSHLALGKTWILDFAKTCKAKLVITDKDKLLKVLKANHFYETEKQVRSFQVQ